MANSILYFIDDYPGNILKNEIRHIAEEIMSYNFQSFNGGNAIEEAYSSIQSLDEGTYSKTYFIIDMDMPISYRLEREWSIDRGANNLNGIFLIKKIIELGLKRENIAVLTHYPSIKDQLVDHDLEDLKARFFTKYDFSFDLIIQWLPRNE